MVLDTMRKGRSLGRGATCDYKAQMVLAICLVLTRRCARIAMHVRLAGHPYCVLVKIPHLVAAKGYEGSDCERVRVGRYMQMLNHVMLLQSRSRQVGIDTARSLDKTNRGKARQGKATIDQAASAQAGNIGAWPRLASPRSLRLKAEVTCISRKYRGTETDEFLVFLFVLSLWMAVGHRRLLYMLLGSQSYCSYSTASHRLFVSPTCLRISSVFPRGPVRHACRPSPASEL